MCVVPYGDEVLVKIFKTSKRVHPNWNQQYRKDAYYLTLLDTRAGLTIGPYRNKNRTLKHLTTAQGYLGKIQNSVVNINPPNRVRSLCFWNVYKQY